MTPERWQEVKRVLEVAVRLRPAERDEYLARSCAGDADLRREVESLLVSHQSAATLFLETPVVNLRGEPKARDDNPPTRVGRRIGAYDIVDEIGRGGMGEVYRAVRADGQFAREVALKLVRSGLDTGFVIARFRNERQILAGLDHPNIARLFDGGTTDDGIPYLVMELVAGVPIDVYCDTKKLPISERLEIFRNVCSAVQYAHQRLVVHRDLKPSNILVTEGGVPKLLDFGIAKLLDSSVDADVTYARPMTIEYASPEQVQGEPITTATDVYSLGVVLYRLLTGHSPYRTDRRSHSQLSRAIAETEPERPSTIVFRSDAAVRTDDVTPHDIGAARGVSAGVLRRSLAGDLDNILLMALRKEPQRRYPSVETFADDIRRHLEHRPVAARKDSWSYRSKKFAERHRYAVAASVAAALLLFGGAIAIVREARIARRQAELAEVQRARAEQRFNDVRQLSNSLIFEFHDAIENLPGATPARKLLLDRAVTYLDGLAKDAGSDTDLQRELAWGFQRLAVVQGSPTESNLGDAIAAESSNRKATALFESVAAANPSDTIDQLNVAMGHRLISFGLLANGAGRRDLEQAMAITDRLLKVDAANLKVKSERSIEYQNLALMQDAAGDRTLALESFRRNLALKHELLKAKYPGIDRGVAMATMQVADELTRVGLLAEALQAQREGLRRYESTVGASGLGYRREMAVARTKLGETQLMTGDTAGAAASFRAARVTIEAMARDDPQNRMLQLDLAAADYEDGRTLAIQGRYEAAVAALSRSIERFEKARTQTRPGGDSPRDVSAVLIWLGDAYAGRHSLSLALESYRKAEALLEAPSVGPLDDDSRCELATALNRSGEALLRLDQLRDAEAAFERAQSIGDPDGSMQRHDVPSVYVAAETLAGRGEVSAALARKSRSASEQAQRRRELRDWYTRSRNLWMAIPNASRITPIGFEARPRDLPGRLAQLDSAPPVP